MSRTPALASWIEADIDINLPSAVPLGGVSGEHDAVDDNVIPGVCLEAVNHRVWGVDGHSITSVVFGTIGAG